MTLQKCGVFGGALVYVKYPGLQFIHGDGLTKGHWEVLGIRLGWIAVVIWFSANLLSQAIYIGFNGVPYDANAILSSLGYWYWICILVELVIWGTLGFLVLRKIRIKTKDDRVLESV
tara:strand:- start:659 stop:1009 length:351 start_codon:yes stop_codon:yes gene_type:complete